jgi:acyl carrier protein
MSDATESLRAIVLASVSEVARTAPDGVDPTGPLADLGIDSLDFVGLVQLVEERLGITLSDQQAAAVVSVDDLLELCETSAARTAD